MIHDIQGQIAPEARASETTRRDALLWIGGLALLTLLSRLLFSSKWLFHWDSVNFALGMQHFDMRLHQPHPPGYFFYVVIADLVNLFVNDPNTSLVLLSLLFSILGVVFLFFLGLEMFGLSAAIIAALLFVSSPNIWFHGSVALPRTIEVFLSLAVALMCYRLAKGDSRFFLPTAAVIALAGGFRQQIPIFLLPLWVWVAWPQPLRRWVMAGAIGVLVTLAWAVPLLALSGGLEGSLDALKYLWNMGAAGYSDETFFGSGVGLWVSKLLRFGVYTFFGLTLSALVFLYLPAWRAAWRSMRAQNSRFMLIWMIPALLVTINWVWQPGHVLFFLPPLFLLIGHIVPLIGQAIARRRSGTAARWIWALIAILIGANALFFVGAPRLLFDRDGMLTTSLSAQTIRHTDTFLEMRVAAVRDHFMPESTAVFSGGLYYRHPDYYLADYQYTWLSHQASSKPVILSEAVRTLVLFTDDMLVRVDDPAIVESLALPDGSLLFFISADEGQVFRVSDSTITLVSASEPVEFPRKSGVEEKAIHSSREDEPWEAHDGNTRRNSSWKPFGCMRRVARASRRSSAIWTSRPAC